MASCSLVMLSPNIASIQAGIPLIPEGIINSQLLYFIKTGCTGLLQYHASKRGNGNVLTHTGLYKSNHVLNTYTCTCTGTWLTVVLSLLLPR